MITLLVLIDDAAPSYDHQNAAGPAALGSTFACTPAPFPDAIAAPIQNQDLTQCAAVNNLVTIRSERMHSILIPYLPLFRAIERAKWVAAATQLALLPRQSLRYQGHDGEVGPFHVQGRFLSTFGFSLAQGLTLRMGESSIGGPHRPPEGPSAAGYIPAIGKTASHDVDAPDDTRLSCST